MAKEKPESVIVIDKSQAWQHLVTKNLKDLGVDTQDAMSPEEVALNATVLAVFLGNLADGVSADKLLTEAQARNIPVYNMADPEPGQNSADGQPNQLAPRAFGRKCSPHQLESVLKKARLERQSPPNVTIEAAREILGPEAVFDQNLVKRLTADTYFDGLPLEFQLEGDPTIPFSSADLIAFKQLHPQAILVSCPATVGSETIPLEKRDWNGNLEAIASKTRIHPMFEADDKKKLADILRTGASTQYAHWALIGTSQAFSATLSRIGGALNPENLRNAAEIQLDTDLNQRITPLDLAHFVWVAFLQKKSADLLRQSDFEKRADLLLFSPDPESQSIPLVLSLGNEDACVCRIDTPGRRCTYMLSQPPTQQSKYVSGVFMMR